MPHSPRHLTLLALCSALVLGGCADDAGDPQGQNPTSVGGDTSAPSAAPSDSVAPSADPTENGSSSSDDASGASPTADPGVSPTPDPGGSVTDDPSTAPTDPDTTGSTSPATQSPTVTPAPPAPTEPTASEPAAPTTTVPPTSPSSSTGRPTPEPTGEPSPPDAPEPSTTPEPTGEPTTPGPSPAEWGDWVPFGSAPEQRYMMLPGEPGKDVVVLIHGGGWVGGKAESFADETSRKNHIVQRLQAMGLWVATVEYRKADESPWPATPQDVHAGVTAAVAEARSKGAGQGVGLFGDSAGGHLAAFEAITHPGTVDAVVGYFGIYDPLTAKAQRQELSCPPKTAAEDHIYMQDATDPALRDRIEQASPVARLTSAAPPMFFLHGTIDCVAPAAQSEQMHRALQAKGVQSKLVTVPGADHSQPAFWTEDQYLSQVTSWLAVHGVD